MRVEEKNILQVNTVVIKNVAHTIFDRNRNEMKTIFMKM